MRISLASVKEVLLMLLLGAASSEAVIVAGANGGAGTTNNTTLAQLDAAVGTAFPYFDNVIRYSDSSGIYLGYDPGTKDVWVMSALHVTATTAGSSLTIDGQTYTQVGAQIGIGTSDLKLVKYHNVSDLVPSMPAVPMAVSSPTIGVEVVMIGWGVDRVQGPATGPNDNDSVTVAEGNGMGYDWRENTDANRLLRWGTNLVDTDPYEVSTGNIGWFSDFDMPGNGEWLSSNEATAAVRDSGGGAFFLSGGEWVLGGVAHAVTTVDPSPFTIFSDEQGTFHTDTATYGAAIGTAIGVNLVPEPGVGVWSLLLAPLLCCRRR